MDAIARAIALSSDPRTCYPRALVLDQIPQLTVTSDGECSDFAARFLVAAMDANDRSLALSFDARTECHATALNEMSQIMVSVWEWDDSRTRFRAAGAGLQIDDGFDPLCVWRPKLVPTSYHSRLNAAKRRSQV